MKRRLVALSVACGSLLTGTLRAEQDPSTEPSRAKHAAASPVLAGASFDVMLGGRLVTLPLTLYGGGPELGYRARTRFGVLTPLVAVRWMRGNTPKGLLYESRSLLAGLDVSVDAFPLLHYGVELGSAENHLHAATHGGAYRETALTGQVTLAIDYRLSPWFALHAGVGYRFLGEIDAGVVFVGGRL